MRKDNKDKEGEEIEIKIKIKKFKSEMILKNNNNQKAIKLIKNKIKRLNKRKLKYQNNLIKNIAKQ